jgi:glycosyltransferase involved in cell wall biosynthesis
VTLPTADSPVLSCSVVIPTFKRPAELERCLEAISRQEYQKFDVIVVDNSSGDPETQRVAKAWKARYVIEPKRGLCRARNRGALVSSADVIAYLDDDSVPEPGWIAGLAREFNDPMVMGVGGKTIPLSLETEAERLFAKVRGGAYNRPAPLVVDKTTPYWFEICGFGGIGAGCNMAVRRAAFEVWPGFHQRTDRGTKVYGGGEQHAFFSLVSRGFRVSYTPHAVVRHPFPPTLENLKSRYLRDLTASTAYFTMLLFEEPGHRRSTLRYLWEAVRGKSRTWRGELPTRPRVVSRLRSTVALVLGPVRYVQGLILDTEN